jgi:hypothetical protein
MQLFLVNVLLHYIIKDFVPFSSRYSTWITLAYDVYLPSNLMDKMKSKLAAFFHNDGKESSFPVRRTNLFLIT